MNNQNVEVRPVTDGDLDAVARFFHEHLNRRVPTVAWRGLLAPPWRAEAPNRGFQLVVEGEIVGAYAAVYSERRIEGDVVRFCNLAAFCVREEHRSHSFRIARALLAQKGYVFTDLSPSGNVVALNERLGFTRLDTATRVTPNLPTRAPAGVTVTGDPAFLAATLRGEDAVIYRDHRDAAAARHVVAATGADYAYLVIRRDRRKGVPVFATPLHAGGNRELLRSAWPAVASHLLIRHRLIATLAEERILGFTPRWGILQPAPRVKMFRSPVVSAEHVDYLYSELALVEW